MDMIEFPSVEKMKKIKKRSLASVRSKGPKAPKGVSPKIAEAIKFLAKKNDPEHFNQLAMFQTCEIKKPPDGIINKQHFQLLTRAFHLGIRKRMVKLQQVIAHLDGMLRDGKLDEHKNCPQLCGLFAPKPKKAKPSESEGEEGEEGETPEEELFPEEEEPPPPEEDTRAKDTNGNCFRRWDRVPVAKIAASLEEWDAELSSWFEEPQKLLPRGNFFLLVKGKSLPFPDWCRPSFVVPCETLVTPKEDGSVPFVDEMK